MHLLRLLLLGSLITAGTATASRAADQLPAEPAAETPALAGDGDAHPPAAAAARVADALPPRPDAEAPTIAPHQTNALPPKPGDGDRDRPEVFHVEHVPVEVRFDATRRQLTLKSIQQDAVAVPVKCVVGTARDTDDATIAITTATGEKLVILFAPDEIPDGQFAALLAAIKAAPPLAARPAPSADLARQITALRQERSELQDLQKRQLGTSLEQTTGQHLAELDQRLAELEKRTARPGGAGAKPFTFETLHFTERSKQLAAVASTAPAAPAPTATDSLKTDSAKSDPNEPKVTANDLDRGFTKVRAKAFEVAAQQRLINSSNNRGAYSGTNSYQRQQEQQAVLMRRSEALTVAVSAYNAQVKSFNKQAGQQVYQTVYDSAPEDLSTMKAAPKN